MKRAFYLILIVARALLALSIAGCSRPAEQPPKTLQEGVSQLSAALVKASPDVQRSFYGGVSFCIRYGRYNEALADLERLAGDPRLNQRQKQIANEVMDLLKRTIQNQQNTSQTG